MQESLLVIVHIHFYDFGRANCFNLLQNKSFRSCLLYGSDRLHGDSLGILIVVEQCREWIFN